MGLRPTAVRGSRLGEMSDAELQQAIAAREKQVSSLLSNPSGAVKAALAEPPYAATNMETKKLSAKVVVKALCAVPDKEVGTVVDSLTGDERDVLMKYLYRGLEEAEACSQLLRWHGVLADKAGSGCIMRALSESTRL